MAKKLAATRDGEPIYENDAAGVRIFRGHLQESSIPVAVKEQTHSSLEAANGAIQESLNHVKLTHPHICTMYGCTLEQDKVGNFKSVILVELMATDLHKKLEVRKQSRKYWTEAELLSMLWQLVTALSYMQQQGISHRDLKPQNLFISADESTVKIGDFGCASRNFGGNETSGTLAGSPLFLSPELKRKYLSTVCRDSAESMLMYNAHKSDVYSLGVTFAFLGLLEAPMGLTNLDNLQEETEKLLGMFSGYSTFQWFLRQMLTVTEEQRPDFIYLESVLTSYFNQSAQPPQSAEVSQGYAAASSGYSSSGQYTGAVAFQAAPQSEFQPGYPYQASVIYSEPPAHQPSDAEGYAQNTSEQYFAGESCLQEAQHSQFGYSASAQDAPAGSEYGYSQGMYAQKQALPGPVEEVKGNQSEELPRCAHCKQVYVGQGIREFCSFDCSRLAGEKPTPTPDSGRVCVSCSRPIFSVLKETDVPEELNFMQSEAGKYCSMNCFVQSAEAKQKGSPGKQSTCVRCEKPITSEGFVRLACGHVFHDSNCVFEYMRSTSDDFRNRIERTCPKCLSPTEGYNSFILRAFGKRRDFELKKDEVRKTYCVVCKTEQNIFKHVCGHFFCRKHIKTSTYCGFCRDLESYK